MVCSYDRILKENENFDSKDFTIFIAKKKWVRNELRPLLELCAQDQHHIDPDRDLALRCCKLMLVLMKRMKDANRQALVREVKFRNSRESF